LKRAKSVRRGGQGGIEVEALEIGDYPLRNMFLQTRPELAET